MAIKLSIPNPFDPTSDYTEAYHKVVQVNLNVHEKTGQITVNVWKNQTAREDGGAIIKQNQHVITTEEYDEYYAVNELDKVNKNTISQSYNLIKTKDDYDGSTDI
jgi:predicted enzyme related to lactoylglutathione lyase